MSRYDDCSRNELIRRIEELESALSAPDTPTPEESSVGRFRRKYAYKILDSIPDMLSVFTPDGTFVDLVSAESTNHSGEPTEALLGRNVNTILTPENARNIKDNLDNVFSSGEGSMSHHDITLEGHTRNYENRIFPLDRDYALCMCRDVTEEQQAKHELEMVKYAMNNVDEEIYACDTEGTLIYANIRYRNHHGVSGDLSACKVYDHWLPTGSESLWKERLDEIRSGNGTSKYTIRYRDEQNRVVAWDIVAYIVFDRYLDKELVWFFGRDVTQRLINENKLKEMNSIMDSILNNIPVYLYVKDPANEFRYLYWNRAFETYSKIPATKALGHTDFEIFPDPHDAEHFRRDDLELLRTGERMDFTEEYVAQTGETRIVSTSKALVAMENRLPLIIGLSWDITEQKNAEMEIIEARIRAEQSDRLKSAFLANMSHEIRTPLNAIVGFSKLVADAETGEEKHQYAEIIDSNSELLLQLINDILDISKIEAGTLEFKYRPMELNELCRSEYEVLRTRTSEGVELLFDEKYDKVELVCDQNRLAQVITNLLTNAIKFTARGQIRFGFDIRDSMIEFYVSDTGTGIAPEQVNHIFDRFVKLNNFAVGTGLGLSISKMIVEKMGGAISVESELGKGACFRFSIPYCLSEDGGQAAAATTSEKRFDSTVSDRDTWKVLVAEDIDSNFLLVEALLGKRYQLIRARNGREAVEKFVSERPDVILMDMKMPVLDGYEATRQIRETSDVPIIAMSAFAFEHDREKAIEAGCSEYVTKPLSLIELNRKLNGCLIRNLRD